MNHLRTSPPSKRGGRRPGAGAKPGNLNALKHGLRSAQFAQLGALLATIPQARQALLDLAHRHQLKQRRAADVAALLLSRMMQRAQSIAEGRSNVMPPVDERRSIKPDRAHRPSRRNAPTPARRKHPPDNQTPDT